MLTSCKRIAWQQRLKSIRSLFFFVFKLRIVLAILQIGNRHRRHKQRKITINKTLKKIREYLKGCIPAAQALCLGATGNLHHTHKFRTMKAHFYEAATSRSTSSSLKKNWPCGQL